MFGDGILRQIIVFGPIDGGWSVGAIGLLMVVILISWLIFWFTCWMWGK